MEAKLKAKGIFRRSIAELGKFVLLELDKLKKLNHHELKKSSSVEPCMFKLSAATRPLLCHCHQ